MWYKMSQYVNNVIYRNSSSGKIIIQQKKSYGDRPSGAPGNVPVWI